MAQLTIGQLTAFTRELLGESQSMLAAPICCPESDDLGVMTILFAAKQVAHFETIHFLIDCRKHSDATIIARVMLEGMSLLLWASEDPDDRPKKWRAYSLVFDLRLLRERQRTGGASADDNEDALLTRLETEATVFLKAGRKDFGNPDAYRSRWHLDQSGKPVNISDIISGLDDPNLLLQYDSLSNWIHWNVRGLGRGIRREGDHVRISWDDSRDGALALSASFLAILLTMRALDHHFGMGRTERLLDIRERYVRALLASQAV